VYTFMTQCHCSLFSGVCVCSSVLGCCKSELSKSLIQFCYILRLYAVVMYLIDENVMYDFTFS